LCWFVDLSEMVGYFVQMPVKSRLVREEKTISVIVRLFCRDHHGVCEGGLCAECAELLDYARQRLAKCPFGAEKGACSKCEIHCYKADMRERIRGVMRYAGPRMLRRHPVLAIMHLLQKGVSRKK
jgi:hypothetical protein